MARQLGQESQLDAKPKRHLASFHEDDSSFKCLPLSLPLHEFMNSRIDLPPLFFFKTDKHISAARQWECQKM